MRLRETQRDRQREGTERQTVKKERKKMGGGREKKRKKKGMRESDMREWKKRDKVFARERGRMRECEREGMILINMEVSNLEKNQREKKNC